MKLKCIFASDRTECDTNSYCTKLRPLTFSTGGAAFRGTGQFPVVQTLTSGWLDGRYLVVRDARGISPASCWIWVFLLCVIVLVVFIWSIRGFLWDTQHIHDQVISWSYIELMLCFINNGCWPDSHFLLSMGLVYLLVCGLAVEARQSSPGGACTRSKHPDLAAGRSSEEKWMGLLKLSCGSFILFKHFSLPHVPSVVSGQTVFSIFRRDLGVFFCYTHINVQDFIGGAFCEKWFSCCGTDLIGSAVGEHGPSTLVLPRSVNGPVSINNGSPRTASQSWKKPR